ncbi:AraC family transcriptional regulator [Pseudomonas sp. GLN_6]|uniref:AraC family transcriptional regulator n=1 Tax=Pseudomonas sp. GLN_6 TaxID=3367183 RepID=UPI00370AA707
MTPFVRGTALHGFEQFAALKGLDAPKTLSDIDLPVDAAQQAEQLIPYTQFNALLDLCANRADSPLFGLEFGLYQGVSVLGNLLYVIQNAHTVGEALGLLHQYIHIHTSGAEIHVRNVGANTHLCYEVTSGCAASVRQDVELAMAIGSRIMQCLLGRRWRPTALLFRHGAQAHPTDYRRVLGITPRFDSPYTAWVFDTALLDVPLSAADEGLKQLVQQHVDELSQISLHELPGFVQRLLRDMLPHGKVRIEQIAEYMMVSPRTLQRYLMEEGTGFQELLDETRQSLSTRYLCDSSISLTQVAGLLGYADLSAFSRAFTRWKGLSPRKWKQRYQRELHVAAG